MSGKPVKSDGVFAINVDKMVCNLNDFLDFNKLNKQFTIKNVRNLKWLRYTIDGIILRNEYKLERQSDGGKFKD